MDGIPEGCKHLYGALFSVPFSEIRTPEESDDSDNDEYQFKNPRLLTEKGQSELLDKRLSAELRESIKIRTMLNPLVCRWVRSGNSFYPQLVGGDRRYRSLDFLIRKKEIVTDPGSLRLNEKGQWEYAQCSADKAYATVLCQCFYVNNDLEALALAWAENKGRINLTEGHEVAEVIKLRKVGASDEKILEILQQDEKWLSQTDSLIANLDTDTLADLLENRIDRESAYELCRIDDKDVRDKVRIAANDASKEACNRRIRRLQRQIESALETKEIAEGSIADAEFHDDEDAYSEAKSDFLEADKKVSRIIKERDETTPVTTARDVKKAAIKTGVREDDRPLRILSSKKIQDGLDYIDILIRAGGHCPDGTFAANPDQLRLVRKILNNNILANDIDFASTIRHHAGPKLETDELEDEEFEESDEDESEESDDFQNDSE